MRASEKNKRRVLFIYMLFSNNHLHSTSGQVSTNRVLDLTDFLLMMIRSMSTLCLVTDRSLLSMCPSSLPSMYTVKVFSVNVHSCPLNCRHVAYDTLEQNRN